MFAKQFWVVIEGSRKLAYYLQSLLSQLSIADMGCTNQFGEIIAKRIFWWDNIIQLPSLLSFVSIIIANIPIKLAMYKVGNYCHPVDSQIIFQKIGLRVK